MVTVTDTDVVDALHLSGTGDLPAGYASDIDAAEAIVGSQVEPYANDGDGALVDQCAVFVACAFIAGTEGDQPVSQLQRESQTISYDTDAASDEAQDFWQRAQAFDPTGRLGGDTTTDATFEVY